MTARERLMCVLNGELPDRVPVSTYELCGYNSLSFENQDPTYGELMQLIRSYSDAIAMWEPASDETICLTAAPIDCTTEESEEDGVRICRRRLRTERGELTNTTKTTPGIYTVWQTEHWCKTSEDVDAMLSIPYVPLTWSDRDFPRISAEVGENGILMSTVPDAFCTAMELMSLSDALIWAMTEPEHFAAAIRELHRRTMENLHRMLECCPVELYRIVGSEYCTPPYLPPELYQQLLLPCIREMVEEIHAYGKKTRIHSHGNIRQVLEFMLQTGADALDPCEPPPDGDITLAEIKEQTQGKMTLFGNLELHVLERGTADDVREAVRTAMQQGKPGGRFVLMPTASPINTPLSPVTLSNYRVFLETAREMGEY